MGKTNFHTHVYRCGHATGDVEDYVKEAIKNGYEAIGISDHGPLPDYFFDRMSHNEVEDYLIDVEKAIQKYGDKIKIYKALELEYFKEFHDYYIELKKRFDYFVLGHHYYGPHKSSWHVTNLKELQTYVDELLAAMDSGIFSFVAHPDLFACSYPIWDEHCVEASYKICRKAVELKIPLEINANGVRKGLFSKPEGMRYKYPREEFWHIARECGVKVLINSDCHHAYEFNDEGVELARKLAKEWKVDIINHYEY